jgi:uncharacterized membrane protein
MASTGNRVRPGAVSLALAGVLFVLYPAIRPFSDETSLQGAQAFASAAWIVAHMLAMAGFILVALGLIGLHAALRNASIERLAFLALVVWIVGAGLTLTFYGAEAYGLHAIGAAAIRQHDVALVHLANDVRSGPGLIVFLVGLLLLAIASVMAATAIWKAHRWPRWSGVPFALGFALYIPQFFGNQPLRVAHGLLVASGCLWIAVSMWQQSDKSARS